jgi:hypothetical protein
VRGHLAAGGGVDAIRAAVDHGLVDAIFDERRSVGCAEQALDVGVVVGEEQRDVGAGLKACSCVAGSHVPIAVAEGRVARARGARAVGVNHVPRLVVVPRPRVAIPELRQDVEGCRIGSMVHDSNPAQDVFRAGFGVLDEHVEVVLGAEGVAGRVEQLVLRLVRAAQAVLGYEVGVGELGLRILVEHPRV